MGNCQASDAATAVLEYPDGRIEKLYWSITARQLMIQNPGHYVAVYVYSQDGTTSSQKTRLKILPPSSILNVGNYYRLISFQVMGEFAEKKARKLSQLKGKQLILPGSKISPETQSYVSKTPALKKQVSSTEPKNEQESEDGSTSSKAALTILSYRPQWRPSLQSISESTQV